MRLAIDQSHSLLLDPIEKFIATGLEVQAGERYRLIAQGKWKDRKTVCDANGWTRSGFGWLRRYNRLPHANWFALVACIGRSERTAHLIGAAGELEISAQDIQIAGTPTELYVFANDWPSKYENNQIASAEEGGPLRLSILRLA